MASSVLLSILAILSTANGNPTPLPFLCPSLAKREIPSTATITPSPSPSRHYAHARRIPKKFVRGGDGLWRRVVSYTLYGSTIPVPSQPTQAISSGDHQVTGTVAGSTSTSTDDIRDDLPLGWSPTPKPNESHTALILSLSLVLALFICFFIISCVFWRKSIIKQRKRDLEAEFKKGQSVPSAAEVAKDLVEKETKAKQKIFARATARWMTNVRHSARQRRGKRVAAASKLAQLSNNSRSRLALYPSLPPSQASSRRSSVVSLPDNLPHSIKDETSAHTNVPNFPPAYDHGDQASPSIYPSISHPTSLHSSQLPSQSPSFRANTEPHGSGISTPKSSLAAHVATDDKALLARLADLASRPPGESSTHMCDIHVSAPAWHDDEIPPDFTTSNDHPPDISHPPSSLFPPPPSKERMAAADLYEYPFSFEDMAALEPELGPSAPPFQLGSAPPLDDNQIVPSAPPLIYDTELLMDAHPSAPQWESTSCQLNVGEESSAGPDHNRIALAEGSSSRLPPSDDITLPGYQP